MSLVPRSAAQFNVNIGSEGHPAQSLFGGVVTEEHFNSGWSGHRQDTPVAYQSLND